MPRTSALFAILQGLGGDEEEEALRKKRSAQLKALANDA